MSVKDQVREYILKNFMFSTEAAALSDEVSLMQSGIVDSSGILELIMFLQEKFEIQIADEEMIQENLDSVLNIVAFVKQKRY